MLSGTALIADGKEITPLRRSTLTISLSLRLTLKFSPCFLTLFHSCTPNNEKNSMHKSPGWPLTPGVPLTPGLPSDPFIPGTPGTPFTAPFHLPMQMPQSLQPLINMALTPPASFKVQQKLGLPTCSFVGRTFPRRRCAVLTTSSTWFMTSTEENSNSAESITRQVNASRPQQSSSRCSDISLEARVWFKEQGERNSAGELKMEAASWTGLKSPFGITVKMYSSG